MGAEYTDEQLMSMPLDQLEQIVLGRAQALGQAQNAQPTMSGAAPDQGMQSMMADQMIDGATVLAATTQLAQMGVPIQPTEQLTPEIIQALQAALDQTVPGLYMDIANNPDELREVLDGIATGQLLADGASPGAAAPAGVPAAAGAAAH